MRLFRHWKTRVAEFTQGRTPQPDAAFIADCQFPAVPEAERVALTVRAMVAEEGSVDPQFIFASDRYPEELEILPSWDSPDWLEFIMRLEEQLNIRIADRDVERLCLPKWTVRELVHHVVAVHSRSTPLPSHPAQPCHKKDASNSQQRL